MATLEPLLTIDDLAEIYCLHPGSVRRHVRDGTIPQPVRLNRRLLRWRPEDIRASLEKLQATKDVVHV